MLTSATRTVASRLAVAPVAVARAMSASAAAPKEYGISDIAMTEDAVAAANLSAKTAFDAAADGRVYGGLKVCAILGGAEWNGVTNAQDV